VTFAGSRQMRVEDGAKGISLPAETIGFLDERLKK
jgi:hypothetical protein